MNLTDDTAYIDVMHCPACGKAIQATVKVVLHSGDRQHRVIPGDVRDYSGSASGGRVQLHAKPVAFTIQHSCGADG